MGGGAGDSPASGLPSGPASHTHLHPAVPSPHPVSGGKAPFLHLWRVWNKPACQGAESGLRERHGLPSTPNLTFSADTKVGLALSARRPTASGEGPSSGQPGAPRGVFSKKKSFLPSVYSPCGHCQGPVQPALPGTGTSSPNSPSSPAGLTQAPHTHLPLWPETPAWLGSDQRPLGPPQ